MTRRRVAFMLATFFYLALVIGGAVMALVIVVLARPGRDPDADAGFVEGLAVALGAFAGMIVSVRVARVLLRRVGRVSRAEAVDLTRER